MRSLRFIPALVVMLTLNIAPSERVQAQQPSRVMTVGIFDNYYQPPTIIVPLGTTVIWTNNGDQNHTVTSRNGLWADSGRIPPGGEFGVLFDLPGTYFYFCRFHAHMKGKVVVPERR